MNDQAPRYLVNKFNIKDSGYSLRGYKNLVIPKPKTDFKKRSISYCGATTWNSLPDELKTACNLNQFKKNYKQCNIINVKWHLIIPYKKFMQKIITNKE